MEYDKSTKLGLKKSTVFKSFLLLAAILSSSLLSRSSSVGAITRDVAAQGDRDKEGDDCVT
jgi:hypothetical protein